MENMTQKAAQMSDEIKIAADEIKVAEMGGAATVPEILAIPGHLLRSIGGDDFKQRFQRKPEYRVRGLQGFGRIGMMLIPAEKRKKFTDKDNFDLESGVKTEEVVCECCWKNECPKYVGYANDHIGRIVNELNGEGYGFPCTPIEPVKGLKDDGCALKVPVEMVKELTEGGYALFISVETVKKLKDEYNIKMESVGMIEAVVDEYWWKNKCIEYVGYANDCIEKMVKPEMGLLFSGATMQNIYQLVTSGTVSTDKGKTLLKLNEAAFMMLLYGLVMPRRAAGHVALVIGVALASAAYLFAMNFAF